MTNSRLKEYTAKGAKWGVISGIIVFGVFYLYLAIGARNLGWGIADPLE